MAARDSADPAFEPAQAVQACPRTTTSGPPPDPLHPGSDVQEEISTGAPAASSAVNTSQPIHPVVLGAVVQQAPPLAGAPTTATAASSKTPATTTTMAADGLDAPLNVKPEGFPLTFFDEASIFKADKNKLEGFIILLGRSDIVNPHMASPPTEAEEIANLTLSFNAITSGNVLDTCFGSGPQSRPRIREVGGRTGHSHHHRSPPFTTVHRRYIHNHDHHHWTTMPTTVHHNRLSNTTTVILPPRFYHQVQGYLNGIMDERAQLAVVRAYVSYFERLRRHSQAMEEWWLFGESSEGSEWWVSQSSGG